MLKFCIAVLLVSFATGAVAQAQQHVIARHFDFTTPAGHEVGVDVEIPVADYLGATSRANRRTEQEAVDAAVRWARGSTLAGSLRDAAEANHESPLAVLVAFVQAFPYTAGTGRALDPLETLVEGRPDCDDRALLAVGLAEALGIRAAVWVWSGASHAGLGVVVDGPDPDAWFVSSVAHEGATYFYVELTAVGAPVGQTPTHYTHEIELLTPSAPGAGSTGDAGVPDAGADRDDDDATHETPGDDADERWVAVSVFGAHGRRRGRAILEALHAMDIAPGFEEPPEEIAPRMRPGDVGVMVDGPHGAVVLVNPTPAAVREEVRAAQ